MEDISVSNKYKDIHLKISNIINNINKVFKGQTKIIEYVIAGLLSSNHVLLNDIPGIGKTTLARSLAATIQTNFKRIQFTPDLLPSDITGINIYNQKIQAFQFIAGPVFANIILADEINRASQKVHSSLLECMAENQVTIDTETHKIKRPFFVIATQNPLEFQGTYKLPITILDRFGIMLELGYPNDLDEFEILKLKHHGISVEDIKPCVTEEEIVLWQDIVKDEIRVNDFLLEYIRKIISNTRKHPQIKYGGSTRSAVMLLNLSKAIALVRGRDFVIHDDIKEVIPYLLKHRLILNNKSDDITIIINEIIKSIPIEV